MKNWKKVLFFSLLVLVSLCVGLFLLGNSMQKTPEGQATLTQMAITQNQEVTKAPAATYTEQLPTIEATQIPSSTVEILDLQFGKIVNQHEQLTDVQWKEYAKSIQGKTVSWSGFIENVHKSLGSTTVDVCIGSHYCSDYVAFNYPEEEALKLNKQQQITFVGEISIVDDLLNTVSVFLDNVILK